MTQRSCLKQTVTKRSTVTFSKIRTTPYNRYSNASSPITIEEYKVAICTVTEKERRCKHCNQRDIDIHIKATMDAEDSLSLGPLCVP
jgi:hypothetical protein